MWQNFKAYGYKIYAPLQQNIRVYSLDQATARDLSYALWEW